VTGLRSRRLRRLLRRAARDPRLEPLAWRIRARRRGRRTRSPRAGAKVAVADRRARIAVPPRIKAVEAELAALASGDGTIVAGPWHGDLETELLYWIPFLRWFGREFRVPRPRIAAVSRPGAEPWYADVCGTYCSTEEDAPPGRSLGPALLDAVCGDYWQETGPLVHVLDRLVFTRAAPAQPLPSVVPPGTIVFWPTSSEDATLLRLAEGAVGAAPVALVGPDDGGSSSAPLLRPLLGLGGADRIATLTAAIAGARTLVGPWEGRLMLGPMLGVPTVALTDRSSASPHLDLANRAVRAFESPLLFVDRSQIDLVARLARKVAG
jgi:hypothetical protein